MTMSNLDPSLFGAAGTVAGTGGTTYGTGTNYAGTAAGMVSSAEPMVTRGIGGWADPEVGLPPPLPTAEEGLRGQLGGLGITPGAPDGDAPASGGWNSVYAANQSQANPYMQQYGSEADARLAGLGAYGINQSATLSGEARNMGLNSSNLATNIGGVYGEGASQFGQQSANALDTAGTMAAQQGYQTWNNALGDQAAMETAANQSLAIGGQGSLQANQYAQNIAGTGADALAAARNGQLSLAGAATGLQGVGAQSATIGAQGSEMIQGAAQGIGAAGQVGMQSGQVGQTQGLLGADYLRQAGGAATNAAQQGVTDAQTRATAIQDAAQTGQRALSQVGQTQGNFGMGVAGQGQSFLADSGYQQQMGDANAARAQAQGAAGQLAGLEATEGPSAAQAQLRQGLNEAQASNLAMARSGRGFGGSASALRQAQVSNAQAGQQAANQSAMLRASENAAFRQRQAANLGVAGQMQLAAGQQAMGREGQLAQAQLAQTEANRQAFLQSQGIGVNALGQQAQAEAQARQMALTGQTAAAQNTLAGSQLGLQGADAAIRAQQAAVQAALGGSQAGVAGAGLGVESEQARAAALAQAAQTSLAGQGQNLSAQQAAADVLGQRAELGMAGADAALRAQQAAAQTNLAGSQLYLSGAGQNAQTLQAAGQLGLAGAGLAQQGLETNIGALGQAGQVGLEGILGGGQLNLAGTTQGGQLALSGNQLAQQGIAQAAQIGLSAEQQRMASAQYRTALSEAETARDLQIAGMQAGLSVNNANMASQTAGAGIGAAGALAGIVAMSDIRNKTSIEADSGGVSESDVAGAIGRSSAMLAQSQNERDTPSLTRPERYSERAGQIGSNFAQQAMQSNLDLNAKAKEKKTKMSGAFQDLGSNFAGSMRSQLDPNVNPLTGQPWFLSDERMKKAGGSGGSAALDAVANAPGYSYKYKDPSRPGAAPGRHFGPMAQDLERTPAGRSVVEESSDGTKMVNAPRLSLLNTSALSALNDKVNQVAEHVARVSPKKKGARAA